MKRCTKCGAEKSLSEFSKSKTTKDGYRGECKECQKAYGKKYREANRERRNKQQREYYVANREQRKAYGKKRYAANRERHKGYHLKRKFGLSTEDYNALFVAQGGCCVICGRHQSELKRKLAVDHDHVAGEVRGLLCTTCNTHLGWYEAYGERAGTYLDASEISSEASGAGQHVVPRD